jgi:hypothetical protein|tara:strand:- start:21 stop:212 length:192 start_codon:yes stop_codon:yes gene_type:complete
MADKIKAARARAQAAGNTKKKDRASRFLGEHMLVIYKDDKEKEEQVKQLLINQVLKAAGHSGG